MKRLLIGAACLLALSACGDDSTERKKVADCIQSGGEAVYSDDHGWVEFIICDYP